MADVLTWRPWWLQPIILGTFAGLFLCAAVALSVMLVYSQRKKGLCETRADLEYIWRFAPTAGKLFWPGLGQFFALTAWSNIFTVQFSQ